MPADIPRATAMASYSSDSGKKIGLEQASTSHVADEASNGKGSQMAHRANAYRRHALLKHLHRCDLGSVKIRQLCIADSEDGLRDKISRGMNKLKLCLSVQAAILRKRNTRGCERHRTGNSSVLRPCIAQKLLIAAMNGSPDKVTMFRLMPSTRSCIARRHIHTLATSRQ